MLQSIAKRLQNTLVATYYYVANIMKKFSRCPIFRNNNVCKGISTFHFLFVFLSIFSAISCKLLRMFLLIIFLCLVGTNQFSRQIIYFLTVVDHCHIKKKQKLIFNFAHSRPVSNQKHRLGNNNDDKLIFASPLTSRFHNYVIQMVRSTKKYLFRVNIAEQS